MATGSYSGQHQSATNTLARKGASVTFTRQNAGSYDPKTDTTQLPTTTTITGSAVRVKGNPLLYSQLGLILAEAPTLCFAPDTYGDTPLPGDTTTWGGTNYTVKSCEPIAPDGVTIACRVVIGR